MVWCPVLKLLNPPKVSFVANETEKSLEKLRWVTTSKEITAMLNYANLLAMWLTATLLTTPFWPLGVCRAGFFPVSCRGCLTGILMCSNIANIDLGNFPWRLARSHNEHFSHATKTQKNQWIHSLYIGSLQTVVHIGPILGSLIVKWVYNP